ncbi:methyl-accepting chemotaxis protein [Alkalispirochaeta americana]|uniref:Methyl-accepting chemotaxis protein n=1 Tax=Alkalispirochaeta americana TaxID=159291 RepID=A0A1N6N6T8_9SPIO|nr:methyl-accepting chemotaxis protein [Alkalispirochaeta americana]SIP87828.1 methyl-accepting chemotaxis protein [Alkalispirochaeta americana]
MREKEKYRVSGLQTLRGRMIFLFGGVSALLLLLMGAFLLWQGGRAQRRTVDELVQEIVLARAAEAGRWIEGNREILRQVSASPEFFRGDFEAVTDTLIARHDRRPEEYEDYFFLDLQGDFVDSAAYTGNLMHRDYAEAILKRGASFYVDNGLVSSTTGNGITVIAQEVRDDRGVLQGALAAAVSLDAIVEMTRGMNFGEAGHGVIVDGAGLVIGHPDPALVMNLNTLDAPDWPGLETIGRRITEGSAGAGDFRNPLGERYHGIFAPIPGSNNWSVAFFLPYSDINAPVYRLAWVIVGAVILALAGVVITTVLVAGRIAAPIRSAAQRLEELAQGSLDSAGDPKAASRPDEIGVLARGLDSLQERLRQVVLQVKGSARKVAHGSSSLTTIGNHTAHGAGEMASAAQQLSQGASEQAASVEEVSASIEQMTSNIQQSADNAEATEKIATQSAINAEQSGAAVGETVLAMKQIAEKISIIEDIARETNMLSLNAAIEAARAGEHGKGFAVVATQVRKLAENSAEAAKEISELSISSVKVAEGAGRLLEETVPNIRKTSELVQEISASSREMSVGAKQVNQAILQLDQVVQQTAASSEEVASASEEQTSRTGELAAASEGLLQQARALEAAISFFNTGADGDDGHDTDTDVGPADRPAKPDRSGKTGIAEKTEPPRTTLPRPGAAGESASGRASSSGPLSPSGPQASPPAGNKSREVPRITGITLPQDTGKGLPDDIDLEFEDM